MAHGGAETGEGAAGATLQQQRQQQQQQRQANASTSESAMASSLASSSRPTTTATTPPLTKAQAGGTSAAASGAARSGSLEHDVRLGLRKMFNSHELADVRLHGFEDDQGLTTIEQIPAHRLVLSLRSPVFRQRLKVGGPWYGRSDIKCEIADFDVMRAVVRFMYTDALEIPAGNLHLGARVHSAARLFGITLLEELAGDWLARTVSEGRGTDEWFSTALAVLQFAMHGRSAATALKVERDRLDGCIDPRLARACLNFVHAELDEAPPSTRAALFRAMHGPVANLREGAQDDAASSCEASICADVLLEIAGSVESPRLMESAVLTGRADIVLDLISRGVDPDAPTSLSNLLPVEIALQLGKVLSASAQGDQGHARLASSSSSSISSLPGNTRRQASVDDLYSANSATGPTQRSAGLPSIPAGPTANEGNTDADQESSTRVSAAQTEARIARILDQELGYKPTWSSQEDMTRIVETLILGAKRVADASMGDRRDHVQQHHSMLNLAARLGNARHVEALVEAGADINECDPATGRCALHCAAEGGHADVARVLLANGVVHNQQDQNGCTALHLACRRGHVSVVELLQAAVNVMIPDRYGWTALHHAARKGHAEVAHHILQACEDPLGLIMATEYDQGSTALHLAASNAHYRVVLVVLDMARELDEEAVDEAETTGPSKRRAQQQHQQDQQQQHDQAHAAGGAANDGLSSPKTSRSPQKSDQKDRDGNTENQDSAANQGASSKTGTTAKVSSSGATSSAAAVSSSPSKAGGFPDDRSVGSRRSTRSGKTTLKHGSNIDGYLHCRAITNAKDLQSRTPLHCACATGCDAIIRTEIAFTARLNSGKPDAEETEQHDLPEYDVFRRACKVIETLLDAKSDVMARTKIGYVPLHFALGGQRKQSQQIRGNVSWLRQLQDPGPAQRARIENMTRLLTILVGVPGGHETMKAIGSDGVTPLHVAVRNGHVRAVTVLIRGGADPNARDQAGATPLALAREHWPLPLLVNALIKQLPMAPRWVEDAEVTKCETCKSAFSFTNRKHHCRCCHSIHCSTCASRKLPIPRFGVDSPVRVCDACHEALSWPDVQDEEYSGSDQDEFSDEADEDTFQDELDRRESQARSVASSTSARSFLSSQRKKPTTTSASAARDSTNLAAGATSGSQSSAQASNVKHIRVAASSAANGNRRRRNVNLS
ncbi:Ankyrin repeat domain-containing protein 1 [Hondaea fermentalgiana]|uniref:Ankyrin repeat domain-containing protein 1 n=1 Tax=Hondaea fermentalgiana TaxID=2315210 RepID=A0A2R5GFL7_9STRA|nr:Ankyrin repeat domain-containing protein 1 [Hondaea fermentalgiana]|eukprot:GBG29677.1 Ankyrin repeat domain-containing protein 1 [Hondaea fermentalgiana]